MLQWNRIEEIISECNIPLTYYLNILLNKNKISETNLNLLSQFFLKYHYKTFIKYPVFKLNYTYKLVNNNNVINKFYIIYSKKIKLIKPMIQLKNNIQKFKSYSIYDFLNYFSEKKIIFKSYFDKSKSNVGFFTKLLQYFSKNLDIPHINKEIETRLLNAVKLFSTEFFYFFEIKILSFDEFYKLDGIDRFKFINNFYVKTLKIINFLDQKCKTNDILDYQLDVLMTPRYINIDLGSNTNSETEFDDLCFFTN